MKSVLIRLEGPMQSWGTQGRFSIRDTDTEPSKSGVIGVVAAALGMPRDDNATLAQLAGLGMAVRVDSEGTLLRDYHTVGAGTFRGKSHSLSGTKDPVITQRHYLCDASFLIALGSDDHLLIDRVGASLANPKWPLFLGRKSCVPSKPVFEGICDATPVEALRNAPRAADAQGPVRLVVECDPGDGAVARNDVPLSFALYSRRHVRRFVRTEWLVAPVTEESRP